MSNKGKMRICDKCSERKSLKFFSKSGTTCKSCLKKQWALDNPDKVKAAREKWKARNPGRDREHKRRWAKKNKNKAKESTSKWRAENSDKVNAYKRKWREKNSDKLRKYNAKHYQQNSYYVKVLRHGRDAEYRDMISQIRQKQKELAEARRLRRIEGYELIRKAVVAGELTPNETCDKCGAKGTMAHLSKPEYDTGKVLWLCMECKYGGK